MWGGTRTYALTSASALLTALITFAHMAPTSASAALYLSFFYLNSTHLCATSMEYAEPVFNPAIFHDLTSIPSLASTMRITTITNLTQEIQRSPTGRVPRDVCDVHV